MVKTPRTRHSGSRKDPVTIELEPGAVSHLHDTEHAMEAGANDVTPAADETTLSTDNAIDGNAAPPTASDPVDEKIAASDEAEHDATKAGTESRTRGEPIGYGFDTAEPATEEDAKPSGDSGARNPGSSGTAMPPPVRSAPRRGGVSAVLGGVIGGIIALALGWGLQYSGILAAPSSTDEAATIASVQTELVALKQQVTALEGGSDQALTERVEALTDSMDAVTADIASLKSGGGDGDALQALDSRIKTIEDQLAKLGQAGNGPTEADVAAMGDRMAGVEALVKSAADADSAIDGRLATLEQTVKSLSGKVEAQGSQPKIAMAIAASALKAAIDRGTPFQAEIETFAAIAPDSPELPALRAYADKGVPTRSELDQGMAAAANTMVAAATPVDGNAGFFERLLSSAESLVKVRPIGTIEGTGASATVARMEVALNVGDLQKALAEYETLPDNVKAAGAAFAERIKARIEVEQLVDKAIAGVMKA